MLGVPPFVVDKLIAQARSYSPRMLAAATQRLANADRALKGDITLTSTVTGASGGASGGFTGPQIKALGRELAERIILERVVDGIVQLAARSRRRCLRDGLHDPRDVLERGVPARAEHAVERPSGEPGLLVEGLLVHDLEVGGEDLLERLRVAVHQRLGQRGDDELAVAERGLRIVTGDGRAWCKASRRHGVEGERALWRGLCPGHTSCLPR